MYIIPVLFFILTTGTALAPVNSHHDNYVCGKPPHHMSKKVLRKYLDACWQPSTNIPSKENIHIVKKMEYDYPSKW